MGAARVPHGAEGARLISLAASRNAPEQIDTTVAAGKTVRATMADPVSVYLLYWTAFAGESGPVAFREDPYSWDARLAATIERRSAAQTQLAAR